METNFFEIIQSLNFSGDLVLNINTATDNHFVVSVRLNNSKSNDNTLQSMLFKGSPKELGEGFFMAFENPVEQTKALFVNKEDYQKSLDEAQKLLKATKPKISTTHKDNIEVGQSKVDEKLQKEEKRKAYIETLRQVVEFDSACKYEEALAILPSVEDYPDKAEEINKRKADLERKNHQKQLFFNQND
jgi:hypothetical protein